MHRTSNLRYGASKDTPGRGQSWRLVRIAIRKDLTISVKRVWTAVKKTMTTDNNGERVALDGFIENRLYVGYAVGVGGRSSDGGLT